MEQSLASKILAKIALAILFISLFDLVFLNWWILKKSNFSSEGSQMVVSSASPIPNPNQEIPSPLPIASTAPQPKQTETKTVETKTIVEKQTQTVIQTAQKEIFVPMGSGTIKGKGFLDVPGVEVTIDTTKYSDIDYIVVEASIWVEGGNGRAWAQIRNVNDNNPIIESQISSYSGSAENKTSSHIPFPYAARTYSVQAKTDIENFPAHVENARLKIVLK